jgi:Peptidase family M23
MHSPVDYKFSLSGNFGELRATHFHTGIDIKPNRSGEIDILSVADGYVSRIAVGSGGYGNVLYIDHPDLGITSVYAHLDKYQPHIANAIYNYQLANESFTADIKFDANLIPVSIGEVVGIMGNTGYSFGRHLHFEIREVGTEKPINPFNYGFRIQDELAPTISGLAIHGLDADFHKTCDIRIPILSNNSDTIHIISPINVPADNIGLAIQVFDRSDGAYNKNGIYSFKMTVDDILLYSYKMDLLSFNQNKQIIGFFDHSVKKKEDKTYTLCYKMPGNRLEFLEQNKSGDFPIFKDLDSRVLIEVMDYFGNKKYLRFVVKRSDYNLEPTIANQGRKIAQGVDEIIDTLGAKLTFEPESLFRNINCQLIIDTLGSENSYSIHEDIEPIRTPIKLAIKPKSLQDPAKAIIIYKNSISYGGEWTGGYLTTDIRDFGRYSIAYDIQPPSIKPGNYSTKAHKKSQFTFTIKDNYSTRGDDVDEVAYKVWIDGVFVVSPFRQLNSTLTIPISEVGSGEHTLKIEARDHSGNISYFDSVFQR